MLSRPDLTKKSSLRKHLIATVIAAGVAGAWIAGGAAAADLAQQDKSFFLAAADAGNTEIAASSIAQQRSPSENIRAFAATMVTDHTKVASELKALAAKKGVAIPERPSIAKQTEIDKLNTVDAKKFDAEYAQKIGLAAHKDAVALFTKASATAVDPDVKAFAAKTLPALQHHLEMAQSLPVSGKSSAGQ